MRPPKWISEILHKPPLPPPPSLGISFPVACSNEQKILYYGTATVIDPQKGLLATARHVMKRRCFPKFKIGTVWVNGETLCSHAHEDIALLKVDPDFLPKTSKLDFAKTVRIFEKVSIDGWISRDKNFKKFDRIYFQGEIGDEVHDKEGLEIWTDLHRKTDLRGMSGSPVVNAKNELVGILNSTSTAKVGQLKVYITPITAINVLLTKTA